jgi:hypothetical protein
MLYLDFKTPRNKILTNPGAEFDSIVKKSWFDDPDIVKIAEGIDRVKHVVEDIFEDPDYGKFEARRLSGGAKTVILAYRGVPSGCVYPLSWLGENCYKYLSLIPDDVSATFYANTMPKLIDWECEFTSNKTGAKVTGFYTYKGEYIKYALAD